MSPGDGQWGLWTNWTNCPDLSYAREFRLRFEPRQGLLYDDSGLNAIEMKCENLDHQVTRQVFELLLYPYFFLRFFTFSSYSSLITHQLFIGH